MFKPDPYDTWKNTEIALKAVYRLIHLMCDIKPSSKTSPVEYKAWDDEMKEIRKWCVNVHERRIELNIRDLKQGK